MKIIVFLVFITASCSTPKEKDISITPQYGVKPISFGRVSQTLLTVFNIIDGGDMVDRAGLVMTAHAMSLFYGLNYHEKTHNEEEFILNFCKKNFHVSDILACTDLIYRDISKQSKFIINKYSQPVTYRKDALDLQNNILSSLDLQMHKKMLSMPTLVLGKNRAVFPEFHCKSKTNCSIYRRLPAGIVFIYNDKKLLSGDFFKATPDNHNAFESIFMRIAGFDNKREFSLVVPRDEKSKPFLELLAYGRSKNINSLIVWGVSGNLTVGLKVKLDYLMENPPKDFIIGNEYKTWGELLYALGEKSKTGISPVLLVKKLKPKIENKIKPIMDIPELQNGNGIKKFSHLNDINPLIP